MKKNFKLIGLFLCALALGGLIFGISSIEKASATGISVGQPLVQPESGWKRIPCTDINFSYTGFSLLDQSESYKGKILNTFTSNSKIKFNFTGSKFRLLLFSNYDKSKSNTIKINGVEYTFSDYTSSYVKCYLAFEKLDCNPGKNTVEITSGGLMSFDSIDIDENGIISPYDSILTTGISLDKTSLDMNVNDTSTLIATLTPDNATNKTIKWTSSDSSIVGVDENGKVTANKEGSATITATTQDGSNKTATCSINVKNPDNGSVLLTVTMTTGQQRTYDLTKNEVTAFITWYNNRANGQGNFTYSFNKTPSSAAYTNRTEHLVFDKISNYDVDEYKVQN